MFSQGFSVRIVIIFWATLTFAGTLSTPSQEYDMKLVQWGLNQVRLKLVPRHQSNAGSATFRRSFTPKPSNCGGCVESRKRKMVMDKLRMRHFFPEEYEHEDPYYPPHEGLYDPYPDEPMVDPYFDDNYEEVYPFPPPIPYGGYVHLQYRNTPYFYRRQF